jgi:antitoxin component YwqK of YwqJK toxin-antitoxin module
MNKHLLILLLLLGASCQQSDHTKKDEEKRNNNVSIRYYPNGTIESELPYKLVNNNTIFDGIVKDDTIVDGIVKFYHPNGKKMVEVLYINGKKEGTQKGYYDSGNLEYIGYNKNGLKDSVWVWYFDSPTVKDKSIKSINYWKNGKQLSHQYEYNFDGQIINYEFFDLVGRLVYERKYDDGVFLSKDGSMSPLIHVRKEDDFVYKVGEQLLVHVYPVVPPEFKSEVYIRIKGFNSKWEEISSNNKYYSVYSNDFIKNGKYIFEVKAKLLDDNNFVKEEHVYSFQFIYE